MEKNKKVGLNLLWQRGNTLIHWYRVLHQGLQTRMATSFEPIQERGAIRLARDILDQPDNFYQAAQSYAASVIMSITYNKTTPTRYSDPEVISVNTCLGRFGAAMRPGAFAVESYPFLRHLPKFLPGMRWKRDGERWHQEELDLFKSQLDNVRRDLKEGKAGDSFGKYLLEHQKEYGLNDDEAAYVGGSMFGAGRYAKMTIILALFY